MTTELIGVPTELVPTQYPKFVTMLEPAIKRTRGTQTLETVYNGLLNKEFQMWIAVENGNPIGVGITQIVQHPEVKLFCLNFVGGKCFEKMRELEPVWIEFAKSFGCTELEGYFRFGWVGISRKPEGGLLGKDWDTCWVLGRKKI